jgi:hypothetical protein
LKKKVFWRNEHEPTRFTPKPKKSAGNYFDRLDPPRGRPAGAAVFIFLGGGESQSPSLCPKEFEFHG